MAPKAESVGGFLHRALCVVENDGAERAQLAELLSGLGIDVETFSSAEELLAALDHTQIQVLVSELDLPGIGGIELLAELRSRGIDAPTILLAEQSDVPTAVGAIRAGAADFIEKPVINRILLRRVQQALGAAPSA